MDKQQREKTEEMGPACCQAALTQACIWCNTAEAFHWCICNWWLMFSWLRARFTIEAKKEDRPKIWAFVEVGKQAKTENSLFPRWRQTMATVFTHSRKARSQMSENRRIGTALIQPSLERSPPIESSGNRQLQRALSERAVAGQRGYGEGTPHNTTIGCSPHL